MTKIDKSVIPKVKNGNYDKRRIPQRYKES